MNTPLFTSTLYDLPAQEYISISSRKHLSKPISDGYNRLNMHVQFEHHHANAALNTVNSCSLPISTGLSSVDETKFWSQSGLWWQHRNQMWDLLFSPVWGLRGGAMPPTVWTWWNEDVHKPSTRCCWSDCILLRTIWLREPPTESSTCLQRCLCLCVCSHVCLLLICQSVSGIAQILFPVFQELSVRLYCRKVVKKHSKFPWSFFVVLFFVHSLYKPQTNQFFSSGQLWRSLRGF